MWIGLVGSAPIYSTTALRAIRVQVPACGLFPIPLSSSIASCLSLTVLSNKGKNAQKYNFYDKIKSKTLHRVKLSINYE